MKTLLQLYLIPDYGRRDEHLKEMVIKLSQIVITTREISYIIGRIYGNHRWGTFSKDVFIQHLKSH